jgi:hypothetical protein
MVFVVFFTGSGLPGYLAYAAAVQQTSPTQVAQTEDKLKKLFQALEAAARDIPRETFDTKAVIEHVGRDPVKLFHWVRDETVLVPYRGALRGPQGVLMDRLGNSLDRALLLHEFMRLAGHQARLARAALSEEQANQVLRNARAIPQGGLPAALNRSRQAPDELVKRMEQYAQQYQLDQAELRNIIDKLTLDQQRMAEQVAQRVAEQVPAIAAAVGQPAADDPAIAQTAVLDALHDHWWVQWQQASTWVDLDPTFADAEPGRALAEVKETTQPDQLLDSLRHTVGIRLVVEFWEHGQLREVPVLTQDLVPAQLFGERIVIRHVPLNWPQDLNLLQEQVPLQRLKSTVLDQHEWLPILGVGSKNYGKLSFTDAGTISENPGAKPRAETSSKKVGGLFGGLGEALKGLSTGPIGDAAQKQPEEATQLTAEWIEYEIRAPGQPVRTIRRQIFDLLGPAARSTGKPSAPGITETQRLERGLALLGESEILLLACQLSPEFVDYSMAQSLLTNREALLDVIRNAASIAPNALLDKMGELKPLPSQLYGLALARWEWSRFRSNLYLDRLNLFSFHTRFRDSSQGALLSHSFDIVANDVAVHASGGADPFLVRLEQGVLDTNAEALRLSGLGMVENTAEIFAQAASQGIRWIIVRSSSDTAWQEVKLSKDVRARIEQDLAAGYVAIVPEKAVLLKGQAVIGWWRVNERSGQTLGIDEYGWGAGTEGVIIWGTTLQNIYKVSRLGLTIAQMYGCTELAARAKSDAFIILCWISGGTKFMQVARSTFGLESIIFAIILEITSITGLVMKL